MSILDNMPHKATIRHRVRVKGSLAGSKDSFVNDQTNVECWEQAASQAEIDDYEKRGMSIARKIYFTADPGVTVRHQILITERNGAAVASPEALDVRTKAKPDASAGMGVVYKVFAGKVTSKTD